MRRKSVLTVLVILLPALLFSGLVQARSGEESIAVRFADIQLIVEDQVVETRAEPFIYEGNVYAPVATVANMLGIGQSWDNDVPAVRFTRSETPPLDYQDPARQYDLTDGVKLTIHNKYGYTYLWQLADGVWQHQEVSFDVPDGYVAIEHAGPELLTGEFIDVTAVGAQELVWLEWVVRENEDAGACALLRLLRWDDGELKSVGSVVDEDSFSSRVDSAYLPEQREVMLRQLSAEGEVEGLRFYRVEADSWQRGPLLQSTGG